MEIPISCTTVNENYATTWQIILIIALYIEIVSTKILSFVAMLDYFMLAISRADTRWYITFLSRLGPVCAMCIIRMVCVIYHSWHCWSFYYSFCAGIDVGEAFFCRRKLQDARSWCLAWLDSFFLVLVLSKFEE
jgi:hypothetical protein